MFSVSFTISLSLKLPLINGLCHLFDSCVSVWTLFRDVAATAVAAVVVVGSCFVIESFQSDGNEQWKRTTHYKHLSASLNQTKHVGQFTVHSSNFMIKKRKKSESESNRM